MTWHSNFTLPTFSNKVAKDNYFANKFHNDYTAGEQDFTKGCLNHKGFNTFSHTQILIGIQEAAKAKNGVARYTALAQKFERYADMVGMDKTDPKYKSTHLLLNTMVQFFSMNAIKHTDGTIINKQLPEYFMLKEFDIKDRKHYAPMFEKFIHTIAGTDKDLDKALSSTGFGSISAWLSYVETMLDAMKTFYIKDKQEDMGYLLLGKDFVLSRGDKLRTIDLDAMRASNTCYSYIANAFLAEMENAG